MTTPFPPVDQEATAIPAAGVEPKPSRRLVLGGALAMLLSASGATAWALDRFVVEHVEIDDVAAYEYNQTATQTSSADGASSTAPVVSADSFSSQHATLSISQVTSGSADSILNYFVAHVDLTYATALKSAFAQNSFGENIIEDTSVIAESKGAVFAVNGDYYGFRETGIVIRNGVVYRDEAAREGLAFRRDGTVAVYQEKETTAEALLADGVWNTLSFGPSLITNGAAKAGIDDVEVDTNFGNHSIQGPQPRTAVGVLGPNQLVFVVVDGRSPGYSTGVTMTGLAHIMLGLGAVTAYNIDGGGSSTMYFNGSLVNNPLGKNQERGTSDIFYIAR